MRVLFGMLVIVLTSACGVPGGTTNLAGLVKVCDNAGHCPTGNIATVAGEMVVAGDLESDGALNIAGASTLTGATTLTAAVTASTSLATPIVASGIAWIRFCGNLPGSATAATSFMSPVPLFGAANYELGGSGCDGEDSATETTADEIYTGLTFRPVGLRCYGICTASTANDTVTFTLEDDAAAVTGASCSFTFAGDATPAECTSTASSAGWAQVAGGSAIAIKMVNTNDDCDDAGDDAECYLTISF